MKTNNINLTIGCEDCRLADAYGRDCKKSLMFPIVVVMHGYSRCPVFEPKTTEQIEEQLRLRKGHLH